MTLRQIATLCCSLTGLALAAPGCWVNLTHRRSSGKLCEVFVTPLADGQSRLSTLYDFHADGFTWMGWSQDDGWMRPGTDLVLPSDQTEARAESLRMGMQRGKRHPSYRVLYRANDPAGTAFISLTPSMPLIGVYLGIACMAISLILSLPISLPFMKATR